jgi:hypothetical protein
LEATAKSKIELVRCLREKSITMDRWALDDP